MSKQGPGKAVVFSTDTQALAMEMWGRHTGQKPRDQSTVRSRNPLLFLCSCLGQPEARMWVSLSHIRAMGSRSLAGGGGNLGAEITVDVDIWD